MRFTLDLSHHPWARDATGRAAAHTLAVAQAADAGGIDAIWANEDPEGWDAFALLGAVAAVTTRAALGTSVTSPYPRHPNLLAASVATLDRLSGGRAVLGLGRGQPEWHRDALGIETGEPLAVLRETVGLLRAWWEPPHQAASPRDGHFRVRDWERVILPQRERVPILLAAAGPRALDLAGSVCDGVIFNLLSSEAFLRQAIPRVRGAATAAGRDADTLAFVLRTEVVLVDDPSAERRALDRGKTLFALVAALPGMDRLVASETFDVAPLLTEVRAIMRIEETLASGGGFPALRRRGDLAAARAVIPDDLIRELAIIGPLPVVRAKLAALAALGITHVGVAPPAEATSAEAWRRLLNDLAAS
jgi:alkanesulfonate monooxygenase SsuD/methylene tetrahydromethanopterin reductase-like flavin-dependent oxidoreductase (luciferase family)